MDPTNPQPPPPGDQARNPSHPPAGPPVTLPGAVDEPPSAGKLIVQSFGGFILFLLVVRIATEQAGASCTHP
jgi:hypothetical protein